ncbi:hypothetical protein H4S06_005686 [Coemansia sp. BCRC 34490]|nr:hypothetical protein H4S06_005686 [Coemansia sp. BCRC 34490]
MTIPAMAPDDSFEPPLLPSAESCVCAGSAVGSAEAESCDDVSWRPGTVGDGVLESAGVVGCGESLVADGVERVECSLAGEDEGSLGDVGNEVIVVVDVEVTVSSEGGGVVGVVVSAGGGVVGVVGSAGVVGVSGGVVGLSGDVGDCSVGDCSGGVSLLGGLLVALGLGLGVSLGPAFALSVAAVTSGATCCAPAFCAASAARSAAANHSRAAHSVVVFMAPFSL